MAKPKIAFILEDIRSTHNVGSIFRTADCFGVKHIYICGYTPAPIFSGDNRMPHIANKLHNQIAKTSLGAELTVPFSVYASSKDAVSAATLDGYSIASLEQSKKSQKLHSYKPNEDIALVLGNEVDGVSKWTLSISSVILEIEQHGTKESLNVANAAAVAVYALTNAR